jgi:hypothetical protein
MFTLSYTQVYAHVPSYKTNRSTWPSAMAETRVSLAAVARHERARRTSVPIDEIHGRSPPPSSFQRCLPFISLIFFPPLTLPPFPRRSRRQFLLSPSSSSSQHRCYISRLPLFRLDLLSSATAWLLFLAAAVFRGATAKSTITGTRSTSTL